MLDGFEKIIEGFVEIIKVIWLNCVWLADQTLAIVSNWTTQATSGSGPYTSGFADGLMIALVGIVIIVLSYNWFKASIEGMTEFFQGGKKGSTLTTPVQFFVRFSMSMLFATIFLMYGFALFTRVFIVGA